MNIKLLVVGKTVKGFTADGIEEYVSRLKYYISFSIEIIPNVKNAKNLSPNQLKQMEEKNILEHIQPEDKIILLDEHGKEFKSTEFADYIQKQINASIRSLVFIVGGAYGFSEEIKNKFANKISISKMTFSHQMIRLLFTEQLYRAFTIINNEPYHNE